MKLAAMDVVLKSSAELGYPATAEFARGLGIVALTCTALWPRTAILGAVLLTAYMGARWRRTFGPRRCFPFARQAIVRKSIGMWRRAGGWRRTGGASACSSGKSAIVG